MPVIIFLCCMIGILTIAIEIQKIFIAYKKDAKTT